VVFESAPIAVENLPILQLAQVDTDIAPILLLNFPAKHNPQLLEELNVAFIVTSNFAHFPVGQIVQLKAPAAENVPLLHALQIKPSRYLPAIHDVHVVLAEILPAMQFLQSVAPVSS
jgi:hypothetical protein